jgi:threonine/homoserine/homoserine lactone efflux protein
MLFGLSTESVWLYAAAVLLLALTPGPVWIYLLSRTLAQGRRAGYFSLLGVSTGVVLHVLLAAAGLSALVLTIPGAFNALKLLGAAYLVWLAVSTLRGGGFTFAPQALAPVTDRVLFRQGLAASVLNPKVAVFYLSLFPQFINPVAGSVFGQSVVLGGVHVLISLVFDSALVTVAALLSAWFVRRPAWLRMQRWFLGSAFGALAVWLALTPARTQ